MSHAYLFTGPRGTGKTSTARILARALNCKTPAAEGEPCNTCHTCTAALSGRLVDLIEIDAASNRGIDEIRALRDTVAFSPTEGIAKIYVIDEVHGLTKDAFNALLKTLEEPPSHAYFILATTEAHKVPDTIISRCQRFDFQRIPLPDMAAHLAAVAAAEHITADPAALQLIARQADGGLRDALGSLEQLAGNGTITVEHVGELLGISRPESLTRLIDSLMRQDVAAALELIQQAVTEGVQLGHFLRAVLMELRTLLLSAVAGNDTQKIRQILPMLDALTRASLDLRTALIPQLPLEIAIITICNPEATAQTSQQTPPAAPPVPAEKQPAAETLRVAATLRVEPHTEQLPTADHLTIATLIPHIKNASAKMMLKSCTLGTHTADTLEILVPNAFTRDKLEENAARQEIATAVSTLTGHDTRLTFRITDIPTLTPTPAKKSSIVTTPPPAASTPDLIAAAEKMFGEGDSW